MRKLLMIFLMILLIALIGTIVINGLQIGNFQIYSYSKIKQENEELNKQIEQATNLTSVTYPAKISTLNTTAKKLTTTKEQYEDKVKYSTPEEIQKAKQLSEFKLSFLSFKLGNYATKNGVDISLQYGSGESLETGNLHFIVRGKYYPISQFVRNIEDDKDLYFRIENFTLLPDNSTEILRAEFDVKNVKLDVDNSITNPTVGDTTSNGSQNNNTNTTNNTNTNNNTNNNTTNNTSTNTNQVNNTNS